MAFGAWFMHVIYACVVFKSACIPSQRSSAADAFQANAQLQLRVRGATQADRQARPRPRARTTETARPPKFQAQ